MSAVPGRATAAGATTAVASGSGRVAPGEAAPEGIALHAAAAGAGASRVADSGGFRTLLYKELLRFWKVSFQTVFAPMVSALLYLLVFAHALEHRLQVFEGVSYTEFLVPGLVMMSVLQNAFANSSSSIVQSKLTGNIIFILLPPLTHLEIFAAYVLASIVRGAAVGCGVLLVSLPFVHLPFGAPAWALVFLVLGAAVMGALGLLAGIWADKVDQLAAFQNFVILPFTFLAGVFYSIHSLPVVWQSVSRANPFFYMIDGFRRGFFEVSDANPWLSLAVVTGAFAALAALTLALLRSGYKLRT
jgi:ABC-2 type transport system permease protein